MKGTRVLSYMKQTSQCIVCHKILTSVKVSKLPKMLVLVKLLSVLLLLLLRIQPGGLIDRSEACFKSEPVPHALHSTPSPLGIALDGFLTAQL